MRADVALQGKLASDDLLDRNFLVPAVAAVPSLRPAARRLPSRRKEHTGTWQQPCVTSDRSYSKPTDQRRPAGCSHRRRVHPHDVVLYHPSGRERRRHRADRLLDDGDPATGDVPVVPIVEGRARSRFRAGDRAPLHRPDRWQPSSLPAPVRRSAIRSGRCSPLPTSRRRCSIAARRSCRLSCRSCRSPREACAGCSARRRSPGRGSARHADRSPRRKRRGPRTPGSSARR